MHFLLQTLILFAVMAAPYFLLDSGWAMILSVVVAVGSVLWAALAIERQDRELPRLPTKVRLLMLGFQDTVPIIAFGVMIAAVAGWLDWAYRIDVLPAHKSLPLWLFSGVLVLAPALFLALARPLGEPGAANDFLAAVRGKGFAPLRESWLSGTAMAVAIVCLGALYPVLWLADGLMTSLNAGEKPSTWELAKAFPSLPLGLLTSAALVAVSRILMMGAPSNRAIVRAYVEEVGDIRAPTTGMSTLGGVTVLCGWCITVYMVLYPLHLALVMTTSSLAGVEPISQTVQAVERWVDEQRADGRSGAQMALVLNQHGHWNADSTGLPVLFPELKDVLPTENGSQIENCSVTVMAGTTDPAMRREVDGREVRGAQPDLRYCLRVACPSPAAWNAPAPVALYSSHASHNKHWKANFFFDVFAEGRAPEPGGYCTAAGELADRFQG